MLLNKIRLPLVADCIQQEQRKIERNVIKKGQRYDNTE